MAGFKDDNFFMIYGWMLNRLNLKGVSLQIFSIIYGFDRDGEGRFTGSLQYLVDCTNCSKNTVLKALKELTEKGYIKKTENTVNRVRFCIYQINGQLVQNLKRGSAETEQGESSEIATPPGAETEPNNKDLYNKSIIKEEVKEVIDLYHTICISYPRVKVISGKREKEILARLDTYSMEDMEMVFRNAESSSFMKGKNDRGWSANFDWMMNEDSFVKILEGNYISKGRKESATGWMQPTLGEAELEAIHRVLHEDIPTEELTC